MITTRPQQKIVRKSAFTLIELLMVITIIAILSTLLMVVINQVRYQARTTQCAVQLRQWGVSLIAFATDNRGYFPTHRVREGTGQNTWDVSEGIFDSLSEDYGLPLRNYTCPFAMPQKDLDKFLTNMMTYKVSNGLVELGYSYWIQRSDKYATYPGSSVAAPSRITGPNVNDVPLMTDLALRYPVGGSSDLGTYHTRAGDFPTNQLFIDGHVATVHRSQMVNRWNGNCENWR